MKIHSHFFGVIGYLLVLLATLASCKASHEATSVSKVEQESISHEAKSLFRDSITWSDSIIVRDTIKCIIKGDTVEVAKTKYVDRIRYVTQFSIDSITQKDTVVWMNDYTEQSIKHQDSNSTKLYKMLTLWSIAFFVVVSCYLVWLLRRKKD